MSQAVEDLKIVLLAIVGAIVYGIAHDQVTARVCVEYFTIGHPPVFGTTSPTLLGLGWGVIATWWVGLALGIPLAAAARRGEAPKLAARELVRPVAKLLASMAVLSLMAGLAGYFAARSNRVILVGPSASAVPREKHVPFIADLWAHLAAYGTGIVGGVVVCVSTWRRRRAPGVTPGE